MKTLFAWLVLLLAGPSAGALLAGPDLALNLSGARGTACLAGSVAVIVASRFAPVWAMVGRAPGRLQRP